MSRLSRYDFSDLARALRNPRLVLGKGRRIGLSVNAAYSRIRGLENECDMMEEDWDNLVILDGCRYDLFTRENIIEGCLESRTSAGSESWEYLRENFQGKRLHDTVYVTANPHASKLSEGTFHYRRNLLDDRWDDDLKTVPPEVMTEEALEVHGEFPDKRLIVHYMQPHFPFIGETGRRIAHGGVSSGTEPDDEPHIWFGLRDGILDVDESLVYEAYRENLEVALPHVREFVENVDGRSVITSDHGNLVGERTGPIPVKGYGHPRGFYAPNLVTVPWLVVESAERRRVTAASPSGHEPVDSGVVEERLADLGYR
jgi:hypothetical protein